MNTLFKLVVCSYGTLTDRFFGKCLNNLWNLNLLLTITQVFADISHENFTKKYVEIIKMLTIMKNIYLPSTKRKLHYKY